MIKVNLYFWSFLLYAVLITPVTAQVQIRWEKGFRYRICLRAAGLPFERKKGQNRQEKRIRSSELMKRLQSDRRDVELIRKVEWKRLIRLFDWRKVEWHARISLPDAAQTAVVYAELLVLWQLIQKTCALPAKAKIEADFRGEGIHFAFQCIVSARLGRITAEAVRLWLQTVRTGHFKAEETDYAAASH